MFVFTLIPDLVYLQVEYIETTNERILWEKLSVSVFHRKPVLQLPIDCILLVCSKCWFSHGIFRWMFDKQSSGGKRTWSQSGISLDSFVEFLFWYCSKISVRWYLNMASAVFESFQFDFFPFSIEILRKRHFSSVIMDVFFTGHCLFGCKVIYFS